MNEVLFSGFLSSLIKYKTRLSRGFLKNGSAHN